MCCGGLVDPCKLVTKGFVAAAAEQHHTATTSHNCCNTIHSKLLVLWCAAHHSNGPTGWQPSKEAGALQTWRARSIITPPGTPALLGARAGCRMHPKHAQRSSSFTHGHTQLDKRTPVGHTCGVVTMELPGHVFQNTTPSHATLGGTPTEVVHSCTALACAAAAAQPCIRALSALMAIERVAGLGWTPVVGRVQHHT